MDKHLVLTISNEGRLHIDYVWGLYGIEGTLLPSRLYRDESGGINPGAHRRAFGLASRTVSLFTSSRVKNSALDAR
jgi:hypothetical protein